jgi:hypothetical protein
MGTSALRTTGFRFFQELVEGRSFHVEGNTNSIVQAVIYLPEHP